MKQINRTIASQCHKFVSGLTALSFVLGSIVPVQAQTSDSGSTSGTGQVITGLSNIVSQLSTTPSTFNQTPQQLQMQAAISNMQAQMNACLTKAVTDSKTATDAKATLQKEFESVFKSKRKTTSNDKAAALGSTGSKLIACYQAKDACATECDPPQDTSPNCNENDPQALQDDANVIKEYVSYLNRRTKCENKDYAALNKQKAVLDCQMQVLQQGVNQASQMLQQVLQANGTQYGQMNQYMGELGDQMNQISALVGGSGPDGKEITGKWAELQKSLYENFNQMTENEGKFKNDSNNLDEQTKQNEAYLDATKAQKFGSCMFGATASSGAVTCWRPKVSYSKDSTGNSVGQPQLNKNGCPVYEKGLCSPAQAARSAIEMSYLTSNGQPYQDADRCSQALSASASFDNTMNDISSKLGTDLNSWSDIQTAYGSQINSAAMGYLQKGASVCTRNADQWKKNAQNPNKAKMDKEAQQYAQKKTELANQKNTLSASLDAALTGMNKAYSDVMGALSDQAVSLNTVQCTKDNPTTMQKCYADIRSNLKNLLQGSGAGSMTTKTIKGGTMVPGFAAPCSGLDGCITTYRTIRDKLNDQARLANQAKQKFVQDGNTQVQQQLQQFSQFLASAQQNVMKQYDQMKGAFAAMGITSPDSLKMMDPEQFEQMEGPNGEKGPFKQPKSMAAVLSGMVQPGGLVNFNDTGMKESFADALEAVKNKKSGQSENIKTWQGYLKDFNTAAISCNKDRPNVVDFNCQQCQQLFGTLAADKASGLFDGTNDSMIQDVLGGLSQIMGGQKVQLSSMKSQFEGLSKGKKVDNSTATFCNSCFSSNNKQMNRTSASADASDGANKAQ